MRTAIVTIPPYASFIDEVAKHPAVSGLRLNTVMPAEEPLDELLRRLSTHIGKKKLYVDLKCRQLRVKTFGVPPFNEIELTHNISVKTPVTAYFSDGTEAATVHSIHGNKLLMEDGPEKVVGPGESVNIPDSSLVVDGYLTELDKEYIVACQKVGIKDIILSFVEEPDDVKDLLTLYPEANPVLKIESRKGLWYVKNWKGPGRLMMGRGDMYVEVKRPHHIIQATESIVKKDPDAIVASRIFPSLVHGYEPTCEDIGDLDNLLRMGYKTVMFGDQICMKRDRIINGLNLFYEVAKHYD